MKTTKSTFKATKKGFAYSGDLSECIKLAQRKIERLERDTPYIARRHTEEEKRYKAHIKAICDAKEFIDIAQSTIVNLTAQTTQEVQK